MALNKNFTAGLEAKLQQLRDEHVYKRLNFLESPQGARVQMEGRGEVLILSSNNYLGLSAEPAVVEAGIDGLEQYGAGTGSVPHAPSGSPAEAQRKSHSPFSDSSGASVRSRARGGVRRPEPGVRSSTWPTAADGIRRPPEAPDVSERARARPRIRPGRRRQPVRRTIR